ncbi:hypothetical protein GobsT_04510 [Gemmata obscuriglobus]|uniref:hypothetical protein n=1 Tax=Gemmata obscuriglobus TaxID=114 RepID=UPI0011CCED43|nr:hypothetical protein [Gemmata obscuriglobus]QEG25724.1 hypothetical protein GobsT_04510 [Gemmata obscuriglobus]VTR99450.1 unnamed protein product [Gemmata obscuriglobus UQM 2246]
MAEQEWESVTHYDARGTWDKGRGPSGFGEPLPRVIFRDDEIVIDWPDGDGTTLIVIKQHSGSRFTGRAVWNRGRPDEEHAMVEATLYSTPQGKHMLYGEEVWEKAPPDWFVIRLTGGRLV